VTSSRSISISRLAYEPRKAGQKLFCPFREVDKNY